MAKKHGRSRNFVAIPFTESLDLLTLADDTVKVSGILGGSLTEDLYIISIKAGWSLKAAGAAGQGPYAVGFSHGDLSATEVKEALTAQPLGPNDIIANEKARRPVRRVGVFQGFHTEEFMNQGVDIKTTVKLTVNDGKDINIYVHNKSGAVQTTGNLIQLTGVIFGRWRV